VTFEVLTAEMLKFHVSAVKSCHSVAGSWHFKRQQYLHLLGRGDEGTTILSIIRNHSLKTVSH